MLEAQLDRRAVDALADGLAVYHVTPGRMRLGIPGLRESGGLAALLITGLGQEAGVVKVSPSTTTGNVILLFEPEVLNADALLRLAAAVVHGERLAGSDRDETPGWHALSADAAAQALDAPLDGGLDDNEARRRLDLHGRNALRPVAARSGAEIFAEQFTTVPVGVLIGAAVFSMATGAILEAAAIAAVVGVNAAIGYVTESRAERVLSNLGPATDPEARVVRGARTRTVPSVLLVPGDLLILRRGDVVPADGRIIRSAGFSVSEAALTGEALPISKIADPVERPTVLAERRNMVFRGTYVTGGDALVLVVATGARTKVGRVQQLVEENRAPETPMQRQLGTLGRQLVILTAGAGLLLFAIGVLRGIPAFAMVRSALSLAVAAVPEGLPMMATTALAIAVERMRARGMIVRRIDAIETLASVDVVCFDKTGTLTLNRMVVAELVCPGAPARANGVGDASGKDSRRLLELCCLCSEVKMHVAEDGTTSLDGSSTETALMQAAIDAGIDAPRLQGDHPLVRIRHRSEKIRLMATLHRSPSGPLVAVKGDPAEVLARCGKWLGRDGEERPLTDSERAAVRRSSEEMGGRALRVLGFAFANSESRSETAPIEDLTWVGLAGLTDPLRSEARDVVRRLRAAGVKVVMITGDAPATAQAIAGQIGLTNGHEMRMLTADALVGLDAEAAAAAAAEADVFARVSPAQKLEIVRALQRSGRRVAMLGDGINDGPALRAANVGLAIGADAEAAREVADIFLEKQDLSLLVHGIECGRTTQANVRRSLRFILGTNGSEIALMLAATAAGMREALSPAQLLWINLVTDVFPCIGLALEPAEPGVLERPPQPSDSSLATKRHAMRLARDSAVLTAPPLAAGLVGAALYGPQSAQARTMMFGSLVGGQLLHALNCRSHTAPQAARSPLGWIVGGSLLAQLGAFMLPGLRGVLAIAPIGPTAVAATVGSVGVSYALSRSLRRFGEDDGAGRQNKLHFTRG